MEVFVNLNLDNLIELHKLDLKISQLLNSLESSGADEIDSRVRKLNSQREKMIKALPENLAGFYERVRARHSTALAEAGNGTCQGCHMTIRYIVLKKVRKAEQITTCENCGRILYCEPIILALKVKETEVEKCDRAAAN